MVLMGLGTTRQCISQQPLALDVLLCMGRCHVSNASTCNSYAFDSDICHGQAREEQNTEFSMLLDGVGFIPEEAVRKKFRRDAR